VTSTSLRESIVNYGDTTTTTPSETVTVEFDPDDITDILKALREVLPARTLRIIAHAELAR